MVTALSIAGDLTFNPEKDTLKGANGMSYIFCIEGHKDMAKSLASETDSLLKVHY